MKPAILLSLAFLLGLGAGVMVGRSQQSNATILRCDMLAEFDPE